MSTILIADDEQAIARFLALHLRRLKHEIILWSRSEGKSAFVLGGGYRDDDGILAYKRSFAPEGARPFSVAHQVFDPDAVVRLCQRWAAWQEATRSPDPGWFPPYRG